VDVAEQLGGRRLAVRAGHRDELVGQQPPAELELAEHRHAARPRPRDDGRLARHAGRLDDGARARQLREPVRLDVRLDVVGDQRRRGAVDHDDRLPARLQRARRRQPRPRQAHDEPRARRQRRSWTAIQRRPDTA
jgi:hypothetical protein